MTHLAAGRAFLPVALLLLAASCRELGFCDLVLDGVWRFLTGLPADLLQLPLSLVDFGEGLLRP